jgi:hypothetical protein
MAWVAAGAARSKKSLATSMRLRGAGLREEGSSSAAPTAKSRGASLANLHRENMHGCGFTCAASSWLQTYSPYRNDGEGGCQPRI